MKSESMTMRAVPRVLQLLGVAIFGYVLTGIGLERIAAVVVTARPLMLGLAALAGVVAVPIPDHAFRYARLDRMRLRIRSLQQAVRRALGDLRGAVALTLFATLVDFLIVGVVFMSIQLSPSLVYVPIIW